ncbi:hypothetical protein BLNAU_9269 [Blattamonas nauphoetae]|uniref:Protein kinase domain-containing protein n=1 Tax=Blattamonas nauphoetae TaxID=2049346 RepID=A0ABQ9XW72_9EUKA|nr:hypothetical protein BLNAU_9269 [Blattamonas nauphoetae]
MANTLLTTVTGCRCEKCSINPGAMHPYGGGMDITFGYASEATVSDLYFEECTNTRDAGGLYLSDVRSMHTVTSLSFKACSAHHPESHLGEGGGMVIHISNTDGNVLSVSYLKFEDCSANNQGGGLRAHTDRLSLTIEDSEFIRCHQTSPVLYNERGGGLYADSYGKTLTVKNCQFIDCSSAVRGGALFGWMGEFEMSDCLVKNCHSESTGAVCILPYVDSPITFKGILFVGNTVSDTPAYFNKHESMKNAVQFADFLIEDEKEQNPTEVSITDCWTTTTPNSVGMYTTIYQGKTYQQYNRVDLPAFHKMGPFLTHQVEALFDATSGRIDLKVQGKVPLDSQIYEVTLTEAGGNSELTGQLKFVNGVGSLLPSSNLNLKFSTAYTITKIVGVVPLSSESNAIDITAEAWAFNLAETTSFLSFSTPAQPPILLASTAHLTDASQPFAFVILLFDQKVSGSYDIVVEERGKDETITVTVIGPSFEGESENFRVVGEDRFLTHDTTYTIKSLSPTPGTEYTTTSVGMIDTVTFSIPKSSYVPPEEPTDPEDPTDPEPEDPKDPKKSMSPETKALLSWLIPLVACLLLTVIVLVIVLVLVYRRKKNTEPAQKEMEAQDQVYVEDKMEVVEVEYTNRVIKSDGLGEPSGGSSDERSTTTLESRGGLEGREKEWVEVMACSGGFEISSTPMNDTLYSVLHKEHREIGKRGVGVQIVNGLKQVVATRGWSDVLTRLSSHWILIDTSGNVQLKLEMNASEAEQEAALTQMQNPNRGGTEKEQTMTEESARTETSTKDKTGMDSLRWRAPEVVGSGVGGEVDGEKASVFSLGLVLWEIETGQVPFGELDAVNAQRQSGTGIGPKMESLENEEFISLIHRCVSVDPKDRPTLSEIGEFLSSHPDETIGGSGNEMKE